MLRSPGVATLVAGFVLAVRPLAAQCPDGSPPPCRPPLAPAAALSVAVLGFESRSPDTSDAFLAEGLADEITTRLAQIERLVVTSRTQVRRLRRAATMTIPEVGRTLNVAYLVSGSVQRSGSRLHINVEVLRAAVARQVWGSVYDRDRADLLDVQAEIATDVAGIIAGQLLPAERRAVAVRPTSSVDAYESFLRGNEAYTRRTTDPAALAAVREYQRAVSLDSGFADAWAALARAHAWVAFHGVDPLGGHDTLARSALARARQLAPARATTLRAAAMIAIYENRFDEAGQELRAALRRDSTDAELLVFLAQVELNGLGQPATALALAERAVAIDPHDPAPTAILLTGHAYLRRFDDAARFADRLVAQDPADPDGYFLRAMLAVMRNGDIAAARPDIARGRQALGSKKLSDAPNWAVYPLMRLDTALMAAVDEPGMAGDPVLEEHYWMKMQRARTAGRTPVALAYADTILAKAEGIQRAGGRPVGLYSADALATLGRASDAEALAQQRLATPLGQSPFPAYEWARVLASIGRVDQALAVLERLLQTPSYATPALLRLDPGFAPLRGDPRFGRLVAEPPRPEAP